MIPKIIMQTWKNHDIPDHWKCSPESIKKHMPAWQYVLQTDEDNRNLIKDHYPQYLTRYDGFKYHIQRVDFARYAWLHKHGGIYMDLDYEVTESLDRFFEEGSLFFLPMHDNLWCYCNSFMASVPNHPFWITLMDHINKPNNVGYFYMPARVTYESGSGAIKQVLETTSVTWVTLPNEVRFGELVSVQRRPGALCPLKGGSWRTSKLWQDLWPWWYAYRDVRAIAVTIIVVLVVVFLMSCCQKIIIFRK